MAPAETAQPGPLRGACLLGAFLVARAAILAGRPLPHSPWAVPAYVWQDVAAALLVALLIAAARPRWVGWSIYGLAIAYVAINVPIARVLSSPLTWTMLRAARPELSDSIRHYLTPEHLAGTALVAGAGAVLPILARRVGPPGHATILTLALLVALGPLAARRVETAGLERNALLVLVTSAVPRVAAQPASDEWRSSPFGPPPAGSLERYRGLAADRNVILVVLESTGARYLRPYGAALDPTPNLTDLARRALLFENAYAVYPESVKGLFAIFCSQYPAFDTEPELYRRIQGPALPELLARAGYRTALFHSGRFMYLGMEAIIGDRGFETQEDAGAIGGQRESSFGVDEASAVRRILAWIDALPREQRFFVAYLPIAGHHPYATAAPGPFPDDREIDRYHNALYEGDRALGALRAGLRERALDPRTIWVVLGDHGEAFGQHPGNYGHTLFIYEENVRVPLLISAPGIVNEQVRVASPASSIDIAPTILDFLGRPVPAEHQGRSLLGGPVGMALFYTDYSLGWLGLRDGCLKYLFELEARRSKLFDLCRDPEERQDLSGALPERVDFYRRRLERWSAAQRARVLEPRTLVRPRDPAFPEPTTHPRAPSAAPPLQRPR